MRIPMLDLSSRVSELTVNMVNGWLIYKRGSRNCFRLDISKLTKAGRVWEMYSGRQMSEVTFSIETFAKITKATAETYSLSPTVAERMDDELFENLIDFARFMDQYPSTRIYEFAKIVTQLQTSSYYKQKGANWVIKNIASDPATFASKQLVFELSYPPGSVDVGVFGQFVSARAIELLIEYKSGPGATICDYINDDGKERGNLVRELVSRDLYNLGLHNKEITKLQWRLEQPPANFRELVRQCLMSEIGRAELNEIGFVKAKQLFVEDDLMNEDNFVQRLIENINLNYNLIFKTYP